MKLPELPGLEARIEQLIAASDYASALQLLEVRFAQPDPPLVLIGPYVLCLSACKQAARAQRVALDAVSALRALPQTTYRDQVLALIALSLRMGERFSATAKPDKPLWR